MKTAATGPSSRHGHGAGRRTAARAHDTGLDGNASAPHDAPAAAGFTLLVAADGREQIELIPDPADPARVAAIARVLLAEPGITPETTAQILREK